jgi:hypothetical protein
VRWAAWGAGVLTGLALVIGLECLPYLIVCGAAFAIRHVVDANGSRAAADYGVALAGSSAVGFFLIVGPEHWSRGVCDAIAINWVALVVVGGIGLALAARVSGQRSSIRGAQVLLVGAAATALFILIEPRCLRGPYAMMDPAVWPIWLAHVREMQPLLPLMAENPLTGIAIATFPAAALIAAFVLARRPDLRGDFGFLTATAVFVMACVTTLAAIKSSFYAIWLGMPLVAAFALHLFAALRLQSLVPRAAVGVLLTPAVLSLGAITIANAAGLGARDAFDKGERSGCLQSDSYTALAQLPRGLIAADVNYGPFLLALTPHSVLAAPYHRLSAGIMSAHDAFAVPPDEARRVLSRLAVDYVVTCGRHSPPGLAEPQLGASLWQQLDAGAVPEWLEPVPVGGPMRVYRVRPRGLI